MIGNSRPVRKKYGFPLDILKSGNAEKPDADSNRTADNIERVLYGYVHADVAVTEITEGASYTRYRLGEISQNAKSRITLSLAGIERDLGVRNVRFACDESGAMLELPNRRHNVVTVRDVLESREYEHDRDADAFAIGKDVNGAAVMCGLGKNRHFLIAGAAGSGKSSLLHSLVISLLYRLSPTDLGLYLAGGEFSVYSGIPHLKGSVIADAESFVKTLGELCAESERRLGIFDERSCGGLAEYNAIPEVRMNRAEKLPRAVLIADEYSDIATASPALRHEAEELIVRLASCECDTGIHVVLATGRPSPDVLSSALRAALPTHIALKTATAFDSRNIIGAGGAEKLGGRGELIITDSDGTSVRVQGAYADRADVHAAVDCIKNAQRPSAEVNAVGSDEGHNAATDQSQTAAAQYMCDPDFAKAVEHVMKSRKVSVADIAKQVSVSTEKAADMIDAMIDLGYVSCEVRITPLKYRAEFGEKNK